MDSRPPIDLPDDFGLDDPAGQRTITGIAAAFGVVLVIAIGLCLWVLA